MRVSEQEVMAALSSVMDPELNVSLVKAGMVRGLEGAGRRIRAEIPASGLAHPALRLDACDGGGLSILHHRRGTSGPLRAATHDAEVQMTFLEVLHMTRKEHALVTPRIAFRVFKRAPGPGAELRSPAWAP